MHTELKEVKNEIHILRESISEMFENALDECSVGSPKFFTKRIFIMDQLKIMQNDINRQLDNACLQSNNLDLEETNFGEIYVLDDKNISNDNYEDKTLWEDEHQLKRQKNLEEVDKAVKCHKIVVGLVNIHVTSLPSNFCFPHKMTCEQLVTN